MGSIFRSDVVKNAEAWIGYKEDPDAPNWTIFTKILDGCGYYAPQEKQGTQWCGHFCNAILLLSAVPSDRDDEAKKYDAQNYQFQPSYDNMSSACRFYADYFRRAGEFYEDSPEVGDIIFFGPRGAETHQGIVVDVDEYITTIEGNAGDAVQKKWYSFDDIGGRISGFGRPSYDDEDDKPEPEPDHDDDEDDDEPKTVSIEMNIIQIGDKGNQVETLQILLNAFGYSDQDGNKLAVDSIFGSRTDYAVKVFQENHDIEPDGIVGFQTWTALLK